MNFSSHLFGRYGIDVCYIWLDIALRLFKAAGLPLYQFLGASRIKNVPAYASLFRYEDPDCVGDRVDFAKNLGYEKIKLHEIGIDEAA